MHSTGEQLEEQALDSLEYFTAAFEEWRDKAKEI